MELPKYKFYLGVKRGNRLIPNSFYNNSRIWRAICGDGDETNRQNFSFLDRDEELRGNHLNFASNFYTNGDTNSSYFDVRESEIILCDITTPVNFEVPIAYHYDPSLSSSYQIDKIITVPAFQLWQFDENMNLLNPIDFDSYDYSALAWDFHQGELEGLYENTAYIWIAIYQGYKPEATLLRGYFPAKPGQFGDDINCRFDESVRYDFNLKFMRAYVISALMERTPVYSGLTEEYKREDNSVQFTRKLEGTLFYQGTNFDYIEANASEVFDFLIKKLDRATGAYKNYFKGSFLGKACSFDYTLKKVTPDITSMTEYSAINNILENEHDIIRECPMKLENNTYIWQSCLLQFYFEGGTSVTTVFPGGLYDEKDVQPTSAASGKDFIAGTGFFRLSIRTQSSVTSEVGRLFMRVLFAKEVWPQLFIDLGVGDPFFTPTDDSLTACPKGYVALNPAQMNGFYDQHTRMPEWFAELFEAYEITADTRASSRYPSPYGLTGYQDENGYYLYYSKPPAVEGYYHVPISMSSWGQYSIWFKYPTTGFNLPVRPSVLGSVMENPYFEARTRYCRPFKDAYSLKTIISSLLKLNNLSYEVDDSGLKDIIAPNYSGDLLFALTPNSNILNLEHTQRASTGKISLEKLFAMLRNTFNIYWYLENNTIKFKSLSDIYKEEDVVYFNRYDQFTKKRSIFAQEELGYNSSKLISRQEVNGSSSSSWLFASAAIDYTTPYLMEGTKEKYDMDGFDGDIDFMLYDPDRFSQDNWAILLFFRPTGHSNYYLSLSNTYHQNGQYYYTGGYYNNNTQSGSPVPVRLNLPHNTFGAIAVKEKNVEENPSDLNNVSFYPMSQNFGLSPFYRLRFFAFADMPLSTQVLSSFLGDMPLLLNNEEVETFMEDLPELPAKAVTLYGERKQIEGHIESITINLETRLAKIKINY